MKKELANYMVSSELIHPGEIIKDEIAARGLTQKELALKMGFQRNFEWETSRYYRVCTYA